MLRIPGQSWISRRVAVEMSVGHGLLQSPRFLADVDGGPPNWPPGRYYMTLVGALRGGGPTLTA